MKVLLFGNMLNLNDRIVDAYVGMNGCNPFKVSYECLSMPDSELNDDGKKRFRESFKIQVLSSISNHWDGYYEGCDLENILSNKPVKDIEKIINLALKTSFEKTVGPLEVYYKE